LTIPTTDWLAPKTTPLVLGAEQRPTIDAWVMS
jgi:hypothetical protein